MVHHVVSLSEMTVICVEVAPPSSIKCMAIIVAIAAKINIVIKIENIIHVKLFLRSGINLERILSSLLLFVLG